MTRVGDLLCEIHNRFVGENPKGSSEVDERSSIYNVVCLQLDAKA